MAREVVELLKCDECGTGKGVRAFVITLDGVTKEVELCEEHGGPVVVAWELGRDPSKAPKQRTRQTAHAVVAIEDWKPEDQ